MLLLFFHFDISGKDNNEGQNKKKLPMKLIFEISHLDMSGNDNINSQWLKKPVISVAFDVFHLEISGKDFNDVQ